MIVVPFALSCISDEQGAFIVDVYDALSGEVTSSFQLRLSGECVVATVVGWPEGIFFCALDG